MSHSAFQGAGDPTMGLTETAAETTSGARKYVIREVADFLKVPAKKRMRCLSEFRTWLRIHDDLAVVLDGVAEWTGVFTWVDDGQRNMSITLEEKRRP